MVEPSQELVLVFNKAVQDAKQFNHEYVTIEHLLFGTLSAESFEKLLTEFGVDISKLKNSVENYLKTECDDITYDVNHPKKTKPQKNRYK